MSLLAMTTPSHHAGFQRDFPWDSNRPSDYVSCRPRTDPERVALPSIRQAIPELLRARVAPDVPTNSQAASSTTSPTVGAAGMATPPEYVHSPNSTNKRRRLSIDDDEVSERAGRVPRLYTSPGSAPQQYQPSPPMPPRSEGGWMSSSRARSPLLPPSIGMPTGSRSPPGREMNDGRPPPMLPALPGLGLHREPVAPPIAPHGIPTVRPRLGDEFPVPPPPGPSPSSAFLPPASPYGRPAGYGYGRLAPTLGGPTYAMVAGGRAEAAVEYRGYPAGPYPDFVTFGDPIGMAIGVHGDGRQRKRRGNLPKETTDKLRSWFVAHLHHPYPTEDEKQDLMRQTGLLMNQISNWFINARRRQLPSMINARAGGDSDSSSAGRLDGKGSALASHANESANRASLPLSDGEGGAYDDDLDRRSAIPRKRGSI